MAILLATYNGAQYLAEQLDSFERQSHPEWAVWASDDGSQDATLDILARYQQRWRGQRLAVLQGPAQGASKNFLSMVHNPQVQAQYYAYSDQDDIWESSKLSEAVAWLSGQNTDIPALYCTRTRLVDGAGHELGLSPLFTRPPAFSNALMQNITGGNTMVFNNAARKMLRQVPPSVPLVIHDWWTYIAVTAAGGTVYLDSKPSVRYRQHENNLIGMSVKGRAFGARLRALLFTSEFRKDSDLNLRALQHLRPWLTPEATRILDTYALARTRRLVPRLIGIRRAGVHRLTFSGNLSLLAAAVLNKL